MREGDAVNRMFAGISGRYDVANHLLSGGIDYYWRKKLIDKVKLYRPQRVVDLATGSGDVAFKLYHHLDNSSKIEAMDFCEPMLEIARRKKAARKIGSNLLFTFAANILSDTSIVSFLPSILCLSIFIYYFF